MSSYNERLWLTLDIGIMFRPTFGFKNSQLFQFKVLPKNYNPPYFNLPTREKMAPPYTSPHLT